MSNNVLSLQSLNEISVHELNVLLSETDVTSQRTAGIMVHKLKALEEFIKRAKEATNNVLEKSGKEQFIITDYDGRQYGVKRIPLNEKVYEDTGEYVTAEMALMAAKGDFDDVKKRTPYIIQEKGSYFKTATLDNINL